jgi:hypothetical protein
MKRVRSSSSSEDEKSASKRKASPQSGELPMKRVRSSSSSEDEKLASKRKASPQSGELVQKENPIKRVRSSSSSEDDSPENELEACVLNFLDSYFDFGRRSRAFSKWSNVHSALQKLHEKEHPCSFKRLVIIIKCI